jgi:hypothetical protein
MGLGGQPILFFPEELGHRVLFSASHNFPPAEFHHVLTIDNQVLDLADIYSVWYRRPRLQPSLESMTNEGLEFARDEWRAALEGIYSLIDDKLWVSHPDRLRQAARKPRQLQVAAELGFHTPHTLMIREKQEIFLINAMVVLSGRPPATDGSIPTMVKMFIMF